MWLWMYIISFVNLSAVQGGSNLLKHIEANPKRFTLSRFEICYCGCYGYDYLASVIAILPLFQFPCAV